MLTPLEMAYCVLAKMKELRIKSNKMAFVDQPEMEAKYDKMVLLTEDLYNSAYKNGENEYDTY